MQRPQGPPGQANLVKSVVIESIESNQILVRDQHGSLLDLPNHIARVRPPLVGEWWLVDRAFGGWSLAACIDSPRGVVNVRSVAGLVGDGLATSLTFEHGLGTRDVTVAVYEAQAPYAQPSDVQITHDEPDVVGLVFTAAPAQDQYRVVVQG